MTDKSKHKDAHKDAHTRGVKAMSDPMNPETPPPAHPTPPPAQTIPPSSSTTPPATAKPAAPSAADQLKTLDANLVKAGSSVAQVIATAAKDQLGLDPVALLAEPKPKAAGGDPAAPAQGTGTTPPTTTGGNQGPTDVTPQGGSATAPPV